MEGEMMNKGVSGSEAYWLDACEDIPCDLDFPEFESNIVSESADAPSNPDGVGDFFGGIDRILDSIKNGTGLTPVVDEGTTGIPDCAVSQTWFQTENVAVGASNLQLHHSFGVSDVSPNDTNGTKRRSDDDGCQFHEADNGKMSLDGKAESKLVHSPKGNGVKKHENRPNDASRDRDFDDQERYSKRARLGDSKNDRHYSTRGQYQPRERSSCRKRSRNWEEFDRRDGDQIRRKEHYGSRRESRDREWRDREAKGYWERDRLGSKEMIFHLGSWEAERNREGKMGAEKNQECNGSVTERRLEEPKEKLPEEQARQYQLDVLEQAKKRNTIAFLETGAGKTLIAVLLIRSVFNDLQGQNKKLLAVFLVPKVPLVYQVI